jgi:hypothetical protein
VVQAYREAQRDLFDYQVCQQGPRWGRCETGDRFFAGILQGGMREVTEAIRHGLYRSFLLVRSGRAQYLGHQLTSCSSLQSPSRQEDSHRKDHRSHGRTTKVRRCFAISVTLLTSESCREGKIKYIGLSEVSADTLRRACKVHHVDAVQLEYSPFSLEVEQFGLLDACRELGVALVAYSPLGMPVTHSYHSIGQRLILLGYRSGHAYR